MLEVRPCLENDFADFVRIQYRAFNTGMTNLIKPPATAESTAKTVEKHIKSAMTEPDIVYLKLIDTDDNDKMIAGAKWRVNEKERTEEQIQSMLPVPDEEDSPAARDFKDYLHRVRKEFMDVKPFYFLQMLITDPDHQRRGAGRMLVNWGCSRADKAGLPSFLEASDAGKPLYRSCGFSPVHTETFDLSKYDPSKVGLETNTCM
ncbi:hypothetical protein BU23DRAFT_462763 [Bimuria novae-zelandiae CBS 107.79]|uniref:N-acetyltransferase domain-containing protein n=1 Tax=Bimuria novae-zelandiae CBS 107.79 TaxID=1447943 RepID=A0A6A5VB05_9PLEO|nr:hypothetical protein BU23DRAFT_462763 [Bimuria novae-zelandiae CBS 107.79]